MFRFVLILALALSVTTARADDHKLKTTKTAPKGLSPAITKLLAKEGFQITGAKGAVVEVWLLNEVALKPGFKPGFTQMYPFSPGQLFGALVIPKGVEYTDFKGQAMKPGTYTLRYGLQPMDGNHVGTSETYDFVLALPAKGDVKTDPIKSIEDLIKISAKAAGSAHPAIFSLLDPEEAEAKAKLVQDDFTEHWVLSFGAKGKAKDKKVDFKIRMVVVGQFEG
jgi:hypothetical protein